jgi:signal transduction histidine kinase
MSLRRSLLLGSVVLVTAAIAAFVLLGWITIEEHRMNQDNTMNLEAVRLAEEAKIDLLLLARTEEGATRADLQHSLQHRLDEVGRMSTTPAETREVARAASEVTGYLRGERPNADSAYAAVDALIAINSRQAAAAIRRGQMLDRAALTITFTVGGLVIVIVGAFVWWLRRRAIPPIFAIEQAMSRFGRGDHAARAPEEGPSEIRAMALRFNEMADALAEHRRAQMTFLAGVAHDLKNPVAVLRLAIRMIDGASQETMHQTHERIGRQLTRLERMIGDFLDVARVEAGTLELKMGVHDCSRLVEQATDLFEGATAGHELVLRTPDEPVLLRCDPLRIEQVVTNLVSNAIKYSMSQTPIEVRVLREGDLAIISVADRGIGMTPEEQSHLFEPFRRVGLSKEMVSGVGLGLYVVRRLVEAMGGTIVVSSARGRGSTFKVALPHVSAEASRTTEATTVSTSPRSSKDT